MRGGPCQYLGSEILRKSVFGACEIQHGQKFNIQGPQIGKKKESWNLVWVSKILDSIFGVSKALGSIFGGQQEKSGMDPPY